MEVKPRKGNHETEGLANRLWVPIYKEAEALRWKDALRAAVGVAIFAIAAVMLNYQDRIEKGSRDLHQWSQGCLWGAITIITVNSPVLGKIAKTSFERCLGTVIGGWLGCAFFLVTRHPAWTAVISFLIALCASMLAAKLKLDYSCKLLCITFVLVLWTPQSDSQALIVAGSRVSCIVLSVLVMGLLAMLIYPQVASEQVLGSLNKAMETMALLNRMVWEEVMHKSREESFRIHESFRLMREASGIPAQMMREASGIPAQSRTPPHTAVDSGRNRQTQQTHRSESFQAPASHRLEAGPVNGGQHRVNQSSAQTAAAAAPLSPSGQGVATREDSSSAAPVTVSCNGATDTGRPPEEGIAGREAVAADEGRQFPAGPSSGREPTDSGECSTSPMSAFQADAKAAGARKRPSRRAWLPVCCRGPPGIVSEGVDTSDEAAAKRQLDAEEKAAAEQEALRLGFRGYAELEREEPFFDAGTAFRNQQAAAEEQLVTALSEVYVGTWAGRKWFLPTIFYQNQAHDKQGWHMPEKLLVRLAMRMRRVVRVLNMLHATFRDGFQKEVLEELEHHFPLDLLVQLSEAAMDTLQAFLDAFPKPGRPVSAEMPDAQVRRLREVTNVLLALSKTSRQHKVSMIALGEEVRKVVASDGCSDAELVRRLRAVWAGSHSLTCSGEDHDLFFPNTEAGWYATTRWYSFHFLVHQLTDALERLRVSLNLLLPRLPGAQIEPSPHAKADISPTPSEAAAHSAQHAQRSRLQQLVFEA